MDNDTQAQHESTHPLTNWLSQRDGLVFSLYAISAAFSCYFCMYAFRKPYTAIGYEGYEALWGLDYKIALILAQLFGYTLSKFVGIKVISELDPKWRPAALLAFIGIAELSLIGFALAPPSYGPLFLFINGLPLGMIWGLVFGFLEGRKLTEVLGAGLSASYIIASGFVKSAGRGLMDYGVSERWMPAVTGALFLIPFLLCVYLLYRLPPPSAEDEALRTKRVPMDAQARWTFLKQSALGLILLTTLYIFLTAYRDFRDNFAAEIWKALGYGDTPEIFTLSELPIAFAVLVTLALLVKIKDNRQAMMVVHLVMMSGCALIGGSTVLFELNLISGATWMITVGLGAYLAYVPYGSMLFDRLLAALGSAGTAGFMIYVTDAFGYIGSIGINLYKNFGGGEVSWRVFFVQLSYFTSLFCTICFIGSMFYFRTELAQHIKAASNSGFVIDFSISFFISRYALVSFFLVFSYRLVGFIVCFSLLNYGLASFAQVSTQESQEKQQVQTQKNSSDSQEKPYALFWSQGKTWLVDSRRGVLFSAPTLIASGPQGHLLEYKLEVHTERLQSDRPFGDLYRWVSLNRFLIGGGYVDQLTNHFQAKELSEETHDEHQILQFTGEFITLVRWFYHQPNDAQHNENVSLYSLALNGVEPLPQLKKAEQLLEFTKKLYPQLIPNCLKADSRLVRWELSGQRAVFWLMLNPKADSNLNCQVQLSALRVNPAPPLKQTQDGLSWRDETLYYGKEKLYGGVVDALIHPNHSIALTLEGAPRQDDRLFNPNIGMLYQQNPKRYLSLWRAYDSNYKDIIALVNHQQANQALGRHISFGEDLDIRSLDGARWIDEKHPILSLLESHFTPVTQTSCFRSLKPHRLDQYHRPKRPKPFGQLCAVETQGRIWEGHNDLSASIESLVVDQTLYLDIWVIDHERTEGDYLQLWLGSADAPIEIKVRPRGITGREAIQAGVKVNWWERERKRKPDSLAYLSKIKGYQVHLQIPLSLTQGALSLSVEDGDYSFPGAQQRLWLIGQPSAKAVDMNALVKPAQFEVP